MGKIRLKMSKNTKKMVKICKKNVLKNGLKSRVLTFSSQFLAQKKAQSVSNRNT